MTLLVRSFVRDADAHRLAPLGLMAVRASQVAAAVSEVDGAPALTERALREHEAITARVHAATPSLPSRFGVTFGDARDLRTALERREVALREQLDRLGTRVEMAVTLSWREEQPRPAEPRNGREYLEARAVRERQRDEAARIAARFVAELGYERAVTRESMCPRDGVAATLSILIPREEVMRVRRYVASSRERSSEVTVAVSGPLAPYSFAS